MLQQTQTARVAEKLPGFLKQFPTVTALAQAPRTAAIRAWHGMGYNRRAVHLHECAKHIYKNGGEFPRKTDSLVQLPGIGRYTASAIACFAHGQRVPVVDVNIRRVLSRVIQKQTDLHTVLDEREIWNIAEALLPHKKFYEWNQALMDIGATLCLKRSARCGECPLRTLCASAKTLTNKSAAVQPKKREPMHNGIPNRIWRGKVVEVLRKKKIATLSSIGKAIIPQFTADEMPWLETIVAGLVRDGLVTTNKKKVSLAR
ncbi:MAG TPA: A/G-specific adenine glycosylase [Candidatus Kapabacteria bacterium]|nr:A/G-specific adenine glycosylase [Candidatus Kapabacteria bacterium]